MDVSVPECDPLGPRHDRRVDQSCNRSLSRRYRAASLAAPEVFPKALPHWFGAPNGVPCSGRTLARVSG